MNWLRKIAFFSAFIIPLCSIIGVYTGGLANLLPILFVYVAVPLIDLISGKDKNNIEKGSISKEANNFYYRFVTYCWVYFQLIFVIWGAYIFTVYELSIFESIAFILGVSLSTGGIGITVAHELGHKKSKLEQFYSKILLMTVGYMHFFIEHNKGHHVHVSTPEDPATSRENESFYTFWWRSITQGYLSAWRIESKRLERKGYGKWTLKNNMIWFTLLPVLFISTITAAFSIYLSQLVWQPAIFLISQSILAFSLLEAVNYIEHYGLVRKKLDEQRYETVAPHHSWNASQMGSNFFLFQLQRHSDHHFNAIKRYQVLDHYDHAPQLPAGYPTMVILAHIPALWFKVMNPRLKQWNNKSQQGEFVSN